MRDIYESMNNSDHTRSVVVEEEWRSLCTGRVAIQRCKGDMHLQKPVNRRAKSNRQSPTGSRKWQFKSPREDDNDDDYHETIAMIRQQLYGPGGPYENVMMNRPESESRCSKTLPTNRKRCRDDHEVEEETAFSQQPAKKTKYGLSDFEDLAISGHRGDMAKLKPVNGRPKSSFRKGSRKRQCKSPREGDNDEDNHETLAMIRQQLYGPGGPYENVMMNRPESESRCSKTLPTNRKRCRDDHEDEEETAFSQQPAKKTKYGLSDFEDLAISGHRGDMAKLKPVNGRPKSSFRKGSRKRQCKSPREGDNDEDNHETLAMIRQQLYGPGGPYENMTVNRTDNESLCPKTLFANPKRCREDNEDEEETGFSQQPAKRIKLVSSDFEHLAISGRSGDMVHLEPVNGQPTSSFRKGSCKVQFKLSWEGENGDDDYKTFELVYPDGPDENLMVNQTDSEPHCSKTLLGNRKRCRDDHEDQEETASSQQPAKKPKLLSSDFEELEISRRSGNMANQKPVNRRPTFSFRKGSHKQKCNHEILEMIRQQLYGPGGPYENMNVNQTDSESRCSEALVANRKRCRDDHKHEEEVGFSQQPAKKIKLGLSNFRDLEISGCMGDMANVEPVNGRPRSSFRQGSRKRQCKSPREGDDDEDNHETLAMIRQQLYSSGGPYENMMVNRTDNESHCSQTLLVNPKQCQDDHEDEEEAAFGQQSAKKTRLGSSDFYDLAISGGCGDVDNLKPVNRQPTFSFGTGIRKVQVKLSWEGENGDDDCKTFELVYPDGPDENLMVNQTDSEPHCSKTLLDNRKRCRDDHEDQEETASSQQPAKKPKLLSSDFEELEISGRSGNMANQKPVNRRPTFSFRKGSHKQKCIHEILEMICQQLYGPGGPYENMNVNQTDSESRCSEALLANRKQCRDDRKHEEEVGFSQQPAKKIKLGLSDFGDLEISGRSGDMANLEPVNGRPRSSFRKGSRKRQCKSPREGDNDEDNHETLAMIRQQLYGPGGPYENMIVNESDPADLASSSFHQQATTSRTSSLPSLSSVASDVNQPSTSTANQGPDTKAYKQSYSNRNSY